MFESAELDQGGRRLIYELQFTLARDYQASDSVVVFKPFWTLLHEETLAIARNSKLPSRFARGVWDFEAFEVHIENTRNKVLEFKETTKKNFAEQSAKGAVEPLSFKEALALVGYEPVDHLLKQIERLKHKFEPDPDAHCAFDLAHYLKQQDVSLDELERLERLERAVVDKTWSKIPVLLIRNRLAAKFETEFRKNGSRKKYNPNDDIDLSRVTVGLYSADVLIAESRIVSAIRDLKLGEIGCDVFSVTELKEAALAITSKCDGQIEC